MKEIVERIRSLCKENQTSITKLESELGFANGTIGKWANGKRTPPLEKVIPIARRLNTTPDFILYGKENPATNQVSGEPTEQDLFNAYKNAPSNVQEAIRNLLGF